MKQEQPILESQIDVVDSPSVSANAQYADTGEKAYDHVLKYTGLFGGVQGITVFLSIIRNKVVAVLLGSVGLALIDIYNHAMGLLGNATQFGIPLTAVRHLSELYEQGDQQKLRHYVCVIRSWSLLTALLGFVVCLIASPLVSQLSFHNYDYIIQFICLSPLVAMLAISGVEIAILKATRHLKQLALSTLIGAVSTLVVTIPFYFFFGLQGIIPALVISTLFSMLINLNFSLRLFRWQSRPFSRSTLSQGLDMIRLGVSYIMAGIVSAAAEMLVRSYIVNQGSLAEEGLYCAGFILTVSYARFVFVSMDADFFPRLSAICHDGVKMNLTINRQLEVCVLLIAPFLMLFVLFLPFIVHLLFSEKFVAAVPMTICAVFYMFFKAITTPIAYVPLARADSLLYFMMELIYYVVFSILVMIGYRFWGLLGSGVALSLSNLFDLLLIFLTYHYRYDFRFSLRALMLIGLQGALLLITVLVALQGDEYLKYGIGLVAALISIAVSLRILYRETSLLTVVGRYFKKTRRP